MSDVGDTGLLELGVDALHCFGAATLVGMVVDCEPAVLLFKIRQAADVLKVGHIVKFCASGHSHAVDEILHIVIFYAKIAASHMQVIFTQVVKFLHAIPEDAVPRLRDIPVRSVRRRNRL